MANKILSNPPQALTTVSILYVAPGGSATIYPALLDFADAFGQSAGNLLVPTGEFSFRSFNSYIATVDENGTVTGVHPGVTTIGITYANTGLSGDVMVVVTNTPLKVGRINRSGYGAIEPA